MLRARVRDLVVEALSPTRCAGCERPGVLLCRRCLEAIEPIDPRHSCLRCGAPHGDVLCTECLSMERGAAQGAASAEQLGRCLAAASFEGPLPRIIRTYKDAGERRLAPLLAELMADAARHAEAAAPDRYGGLVSEADAIVFVPATATAFRRRGFDHMEAVATELSRVACVPLCDALAKRGSGDQRALGRDERLRGACGLYHVVEDVAGRRLLLVDDVITTGATVRAAAGALSAAGASRVDVLALARVW